MTETYRRRSRVGEATVTRGTAALVLCLGLAGCSLSLTGSSDEKVETTGSIKRAAPTTLSSDLGQEDWRRARGALSIALDPQGSGAAVKWDNPDSQTAGTVTPVGQPFVKDDEICRAFLATIDFPSRSASLQGTACKISADDWELKDVRPWRKPS